MYKSYDCDFFKKWTTEMAYVLGFFAADGNMIKTKRGTHFISFSSADIDIISDIKTVMKADHKLSKRKSVTGCVYRFQIGSKSIFNDLVSLGFGERKASRMIMPHIPDVYTGDFIRGYFDGDGNVWIGDLNKKRVTSTRVLQVSFTSGSRTFLVGLLNLLHSGGVLGGALYTSKTRNFSRLQLSTLDALKLYEIMYNGQPKLYLQRKKLRFDQFRSERTANERIK